MRARSGPNSAEEIAREVRRLKEVSGPRLVIRPSREAILPDVPPLNIEAMARAATE